ncbi:hypothetical protein [Moraxella sp.]|uniref:hypothetical protein n=1 Tax=Moraxella sp. TaxID=479 RepID=UPI0026DC408E|nr:hypothetical protein [Moraxella sp.]MDO4894577.1 hypothetical protein [Moraxella sp.]
MIVVLFLHLIGASIWVGGHLYLLIRVMPPILKTGDVKAFLAFEQSYEPLGMTALAIQVVTGLYMVHRYLPDWSMLIDGRAGVLGHLVLAKLFWLLLTLITALHARFFVVKKLINGSHTPNTLTIMYVHVILICLWSLAFVATGLAFG